MFRTAPLQAERTMQVPRILLGLHCRELPDDPTLLEIAARGRCSECGARGFFNHQRIMKPEWYSKYVKEGVIGSIQFWTSELKPTLVPAGPIEGMKLCPPCHLKWLDPVTFAKEGT